MKKNRILLLFSLSILISILFTSCTGGTAINNWPGISVNGETAYLSYQGAVYAVNSGTGTMVWRFPKDKPDPSKPFYAAPAFGPDGLIVVGNYGGVLYGLNTNGEQKWSFAPTTDKGQSEGGHFVASALVVGETVLAPSSNSYLYALSLIGQKKWKFKAQSGLWAQPASDGKLVFQAGLDHNLYAVNLESGNLAWKVDLGSALLSAPLVSGEMLYITTLEGNVAAVKSSDGSVVWQKNTGGRFWSTPAILENVLYVGNMIEDKDGKILALSTKDGSISWEKSVGSPIVGGGTVIKDAVVFPTEGGSLVAWDLKGEKQLWTQPISGKLYTTPVVAGESLVTAISGGDKLIQAFSLAGQPSWSFVMPK